MKCEVGPCPCKSEVGLFGHNNYVSLDHTQKPPARQARTATRKCSKPSGSGKSMMASQYTQHPHGWFPVTGGIPGLGGGGPDGLAMDSSGRNKALCTWYRDYPHLAHSTLSFPVQTILSTGPSGSVRDPSFSSTQICGQCSGCPFPVLLARAIRTISVPPRKLGGGGSRDNSSRFCFRRMPNFRTIRIL